MLGVAGNMPLLPALICRFCAREIRQCGPGCRKSGYIHTDTELHVCEPRNLIQRWKTDLGYTGTTYYGYPLRIVRTAKVRMYRNNDGGGS